MEYVGVIEAMAPSRGVRMPVASGSVLEPLRAALFPGDGGGLNDGQLLDLFLTASSSGPASSREGAFTALVRRHGPMVWGVCRRVLSSFHDAEDAFQATFLILVRKADSVVPREQVGNWLYGVAYRTALDAKTSAARRRAHEDRLRDRCRVAASADWATEGCLDDLRPLLDRELSRLPHYYRAPVVLCDLEGKSRKEAARQLGLAEGTLSSRLARARQRLARRLARHGLSAGVLGALLSADDAWASVPPALVRSTIHVAATGAASASVASLMEGVLKAMFMTKLKIVVAGALVAVLLVLGAGALALHAAAGPVAQPDDTKKKTGADDAPKQKKDQGPVLKGVLRNVDAGQNTITVAVAIKADTKGTEDKTFTLAPGVRVILDDRLTKDKDEPAREGKLADLPERTEVSLQLSEDKKTVTAITARGPGLHAGVRSVDPAGNAITVGVKEDGAVTDKTFVLAKDARVLLNDGLSKDTPDKEGKLADLAEGTHVQLRLSVDRKTALCVRVQGAGVHGRFKSYDANTRTITIEVKEDGALVDKSFTVAKEARLNDLTEGSIVNLRLSVFDKDLVVAAQGKKEGGEE